MIKSVRVAKYCNVLPASAVTTRSVDILKERLDYVLIEEIPHLVV